MKFILILSLISTLLFATEKIEKEIVMLKISSECKVSKNTFDIFRSGAEMSLTESNNFALLDEKTQNEALQNGKSECLDDSCLIDTGKMLAAKILFVVNIKKTKKYYLFNAKIVNLETSTTEKSVSVLYENSLENEKKLLEFSKKLVTNTLARKEKSKIIFNFLKTSFIIDLTKSYELLYLSSGIGIEFLNFNYGIQTITLGSSFYRNFTDSYNYIDLYLDYKFNIINRLNIGISSSFILASKNAITFAMLIDYEYIIKNDFFIKAKIRLGYNNFNMKNSTLKEHLFTTSGISFGWNGF